MYSFEGGRCWVYGVGLEVIDAGFVRHALRIDSSDYPSVFSDIHRRFVSAGV